MTNLRGRPTTFVGAALAALILGHFAVLRAHFDPGLESLIPAEVDGHAADAVSSFPLCAIPSDAELFADALPKGWDIGTISVAVVTFDYAEMPILGAHRFPGQPAELARDAAYLVIPVDPDSASEEHLGGKSVTVFPEWGTTYVYVSGDVLFDLSDSNSAHARQILAALP